MSEQTKLTIDKPSLFIEGTSGGDIMISGLFDEFYKVHQNQLVFYFSDGTVITSYSVGGQRYYEHAVKGSKCKVNIKDYNGFYFVEVTGPLDWFVTRVLNSIDIENNILYFCCNKKIEMTELEKLKCQLIKNYKNVQTSKECDIETFFANVLRSTIKPDLFKDYQIK